MDNQGLQISYMAGHTSVDWEVNQGGLQGTEAGVDMLLCNNPLHSVDLACVDG